MSLQNYKSHIMGVYGEATRWFLNSKAGFPVALFCALLAILVGIIWGINKVADLHSEGAGPLSLIISFTSLILLLAIMVGLGFLHGVIPYARSLILSESEEVQELRNELWRARQELKDIGSENRRLQSELDHLNSL